MPENSLSVVHSIFDGQDLIKKIGIKYPIDTADTCKLFKRGLNDTYLLEAANNRYILRIYRHRWRSKKAIKFELEVLDFLRCHQQAIAPPIPNHDGQFITEVMAPEGKRYAVVFLYAPGRAVNHQLNVVQSYIFGRNLANIHTCLDTFTCNHQGTYNRPVLDSKYLLDWSYKQIKSLYLHRPQQLQALQLIIKNIKKQFKQVNLAMTSPLYGICVGDAHPGNAHFTADNQMTLFDFDQCGYGWRIFDIAKFMHASLQMDIEDAVINCFLDGYQDIRELSDAELTAIPLLIKMAHIWVMGIATSTVGDVIPYSFFDDDWLDAKLEILML